MNSRGLYSDDFPPATKEVLHTCVKEIFIRLRNLDNEKITDSEKVYWGRSCISYLLELYKRTNLGKTYFVINMRVNIEKWVSENPFSARSIILTYLIPFLGMYLQSSKLPRNYGEYLELFV